MAAPYTLYAVAPGCAVQVTVAPLLPAALTDAAKLPLAPPLAGAAAPAAGVTLGVRFAPGTVATVAVGKPPGGVGGTGTRVLAGVVLTVVSRYGLAVPSAAPVATVK